jgi:type II secretion system protein G
MKVRKNNKSGFTLIELLVVIAIISLLSSVVSASLSSARGKARDAVRLSDIRQISSALELYYSDNGSYPNITGMPALSVDLSGDPGSQGWGDGTSAFAQALSPYLKKMPLDPRNNDVTCYAAGAHFYTYLYFGPNSYGIYASLENPKPGATDPANFPCCAATCMYKASNGGVAIIN